MSSSDAPAKKRLRIEAGVPDAHTTVFDAWDHVVHEHRGRQTEVELPPGLYTLRVERGGLLEETVVRHVTDQLVEPSVPGRYTSALLAGAKTSHEYYTDPAVRYSSQMTAPDLEGDDQSGLFLFVRSSNVRAGQGADVSEGLSLVTPSQLPLPLQGDLIERDTTHGWMAFSARAAPGTYYLRYAGEDRRIVPIHLSRGWQTQVFLTHRERPLFGGMRVFQAQRHQGFAPNDETSDAVDRALNDLQFNTRSVSRDEMNHLLGGKFANPMLGLLAGHLLLRREQPNQSLLRTVLTNLHQLAGDSPDFAALCFRVHRRFPDEGLAPLPPPTMAEPPMIRDGFLAVVDASAEDLNLIPPYSIMEGAATGLYSDSPWTSWHFEEPPTTEATRGFFGHAPAPGAAAEEMDWVQVAVLDHLEGSSGDELIVNPSALARSIGVSQGLIRSALASLHQRPAKGIEPEWPGVGQALEADPDALKPQSVLDLESPFDEGELQSEGESTA